MAELDLQKENIEFEQMLSENSSDTVIRGEYLIPDTHPDVSEILSLDVKPTVTTKEVMQDKIFVEGQLEYTVLYLAREEEGMGVYGVSYSEKFASYIDVPGTDHRMNCDITTNIEHIECSIVNERKVSIEGIIAINSELYANNTVSIVRDMEPSENVQMLKTPAEIDKMVSVMDIEMNAKSNMKITMDKAQIGKVLKYNMFIHKKDIVLQEGKAIVSAFVKVGVLYRGADTKDIFLIEDDVYVSKDVEMDGVNSSMKAMVDLKIDNMNINIKQDDLGENRLVEVDAEIKGKVKVIAKEKIEMIDDAYCPKCMIELKKDKVELNVLHGKNEAEIIVKDNIELDNDAPTPTSVVMSKADVTVTDKKVTDDKVYVEGVVKADIIYKSSDEKYLYNVKEELPFTAVLDIPGTTSTMNTVVKANLESIDASVEANTIAVKAIVSVAAKVMYNDNKEMVTSINKIDGEVPRKKASITIYVVQTGDTLWGIAKKYFTTIEEIVKMNSAELQDNLKAGMKILIPGRAII